jgi:hypothetical protein
MPAFSASQIPPPKNWQEFESLCWDLWRRIWNDPYTQKNGRFGQPQFGVDVCGRRGLTWVGLQAKGKDNFTDQRVTVPELRDEVEKAKGFTPKLGEFILATTGPKDVAVEQTARELTDAHRAVDLFSVSVLGWDGILLLLEDQPEVIVKFYPWVQPVAGTAAGDLVTRFSCHANSVIEALSHVGNRSPFLGIQQELVGLARTAEGLGIPVPIEIETIPYPAGVEPHNPFLRDCMEGRYVIRFPGGSEERGTVGHAHGVELLIDARQSAIVALKQWLIHLQHGVVGGQ